MTHKDTDLWKLSMEFVTEIYTITKIFPSEEKFGLSSQMRRAAVSIPSNIAEGAARRNAREMMQFVYISLGSLAEVETQLEIAMNLNFIKDCEEANRKIQRIRCMMVNLIKYLKNKAPKSKGG